MIKIIKAARKMTKRDNYTFKNAAEQVRRAHEGLSKQTIRKLSPSNQFTETRKKKSEKISPDQKSFENAMSKLSKIIMRLEYEGKIDDFDDD